MSTSVSVSVVFVWGTICLAFWRYYIWNRKHEKHLKGPKYGRYNRRKNSGLGVPTILARFQPVVAIFGFIGCFLIVYVFTTAVWWKGRPQSKDVIAYYAVPVLVIVCWISLKAIRYASNGWSTTRHTQDHTTDQYFWYVVLSDHSRDFLKTLDNLTWLKNSQIEAEDGPPEEVELREVYEGARRRGNHQALRDYLQDYEREGSTTKRAADLSRHS